MVVLSLFFSSRRRHTRCALVTGVQTCALPISTYIEDRRRSPRDDIMTAMATAPFPDGTTPEVHDVALLAANLFTAGQETTVRLLYFALRIIAARAHVPQRLRDARSQQPTFISETLRYDSPLTAHLRTTKS